MFDERGPLARGTDPAPATADDGAALSSAEYRPWIVQRGRTQPALLLNQRRYDPRSGLLLGWQASYPYLVAADYVGERMISLDFGTRHFVIKGHGLGELLRHLQQGTVLAIQEYCAQVWPQLPEGPVVTAIKKVEPRYRETSREYDG
ncbi:MAG: hypothetical protein JOZ90_10990 [Alphaproteobacteria bacterium]|nr:hypothetical protein [Alphaproteobacteria bacterium]MBV9371016.1 hypothetical protein [Alphaproteobacteria bacterium]MBV9901611.1 hypothetical protein [Alphaproteobacteria bacterium]